MVREIKELYSEDRPREKLFRKGASSLRTYELIALMLGSGGKERSLFTIARELETALEEKSWKNPEKLLEIEGIGKAKACQIAAAFELVSRYTLENSKRKITSSSDAFVLLGDLSKKRQENFITLTLDGANRLIKTRTIFIGTLNQSLIHPREVFADAITDRAASIIFAHNHPSGNLEPSHEDIQVTKRLIESAKILGIEVLDHIIVGKGNHFSFKANNLI